MAQIASGIGLFTAASDGNEDIVGKILAEDPNVDAYQDEVGKATFVY